MDRKLTAGQKQVLVAILDAAPKSLIFNLNGKNGIIREKEIVIPLVLPTDYNGNLWNDTYIVKAFLNDYGFTEPINKADFQSEIQFTVEGKALYDAKTLDEYERRQRRKKRGEFWKNWMPNVWAGLSLVMSILALCISYLTYVHDTSKERQSEQQPKRQDKIFETLDSNNRSVYRKDTLMNAADSPFGSSVGTKSSKL